MTIWKDIKGYEGRYQVSSCGQIKTVDRKVKCRGGYMRMEQSTLLQQATQWTGHKTVCLYKDSKMKCFRVHRLVAIAFLDNPHNLPVINHIDSNPANNNVSNLEWCTQSHNCLHAWQNTRTDCNLKKLTTEQVKEIRATASKNNYKELALKFKVTEMSIRNIHLRRTWKNV